MKTIKRYLALAVIVNTMVLSACGGTGSDQQTLEQRSEEATTADAQTVEETTTTNSISNNAEVPSNQGQVYPIEIKLLDEKHMDIILDTEGITGKDTNLNEIFSLYCRFPASGCEIHYEGELPTEDGSNETVPPRGYAYFDTTGDFGDTIVERISDKQFILHLDLTWDESITDIHSVFDKSEKCVVCYYLFDDSTEYTSEYPCADIINQSEYQAINESIPEANNTGDGNKESLLVGTWVCNDFNEDTGFNGSITMTFHSSGTMDYTVYHGWSGVTDEYEFTKYSFDGKTIHASYKLDTGESMVLDMDIAMGTGSFTCLDEDAYGNHQVYHKQ